MPSTRKLVLHDNLLQGMDSTLPAHLIGQAWRTQHNMRLTPALQQIPHKVLYETFSGGADIRWMGFIPGGLLGYGTPRIITPTGMFDSTGTALSPVYNDDGAFRRWAVCVYNDQLYYTNELNQIHNNSLSGDTILTNSPQARYLVAWYDHLVAAYTTFNGTISPARLMISHLYDFNTWQPDATNEADFYDFVEWESTEYALSGITGIGKLRNTLFVYTPTAIIPVRYVGMPKVLNVDESGVLTRIGNGMPWTLVCLDNVHFFFDAIEGTFFAFDGQQVHPIGEPIRNYIQANLNTDPTLATKMYGYVDVDNREIWWPFVSTASSGAFDQAVVFNYRYKKWYTASVENIISFSGKVFTPLDVAQLTGTVAGLAGTVGQLGLTGAGSPRLFGSSSGKIYREETPSDSDSSLITQDDPELESADFAYGDIRTYKENDLMLINASFTAMTLPELSINDVYHFAGGGTTPLTITGLTIGNTYFFNAGNGQLISTVDDHVFLLASGFFIADATTALVAPAAGTPPAGWTGSIYYTSHILTTAGQLYTWSPPSSAYYALKNGNLFIIPTTFPASVQFTAQGTDIYIYTPASISLDYVIPTAGLNVQANGRDYLGGEVNWGSDPIRGSWAPNLQDGQITYAAVRGRILRYNFVAKFIRFLLMSAFSDGVYRDEAEK